MPVLGIYHVNLNVSDLERSRAFYERLGFRVVDTFHEDGNADLDRGLGLPRSHTKALFLRLGDDPRSTLIDLVEWSEPRAVGPAPEMNHLGPVRLALRVKELDRLVADLREAGVEFLSPPQTLGDLPRRPRFVVLRDPDGLFVELVELPSTHPPGLRPTP